VLHFQTSDLDPLDRPGQLFDTEASRLERIPPEKTKMVNAYDKGHEVELDWLRADPDFKFIDQEKFRAADGAGSREKVHRCMLQGRGSHKSWFEGKLKYPRDERDLPLYRRREEKHRLDLARPDDTYLRRGERLQEHAQATRGAKEEEEMSDSYMQPAHVFHAHPRRVRQMMEQAQAKQVTPPSPSAAAAPGPPSSAAAAPGLRFKDLVEDQSYAVKVASMGLTRKQWRAFSPEQAAKLVHIWEDQLYAKLELFCPKSDFPERHIGIPRGAGLKFYHKLTRDCFQPNPARAQAAKLAYESRKQDQNDKAGRPSNSSPRSWRSCTRPTSCTRTTSRTARSTRSTTSA
jgi:hypothetical protein